MIFDMAKSLAEAFSLLDVPTREEWINSQPLNILKEITRGEWWWLARPEQIPPPGDWLVHLVLAGRGFGKSRSGSEWLVQRILDYPYDRHGTPTEWLVIAETLSDSRIICVEGPAGILRVLQRRGIPYRYIKSPKPMIIFTETGSKIYCEGADDADVGRGYNAAGAWLDEICKWKQPRASWYEGIMPSLRADLMGDHPRVFVTTTPKPVDILREWVQRTDGTVSLVRGSTFDNASNLSQHVVSELRTRYEGTAIGRQELYGELLEALEGAMFSRLDIENHRVWQIDEHIMSTIVGVDPNLTGEGDEMGVVVLARGKSNHQYVLADRSSPKVGRDAARHCWEIMAEYGADVLLYESNLGKVWMKEVLADTYQEMCKEGLFPKNTTAPMKAVDSKAGKKTRAEPVALRLEQGRLHFVGRHPELETQCAEFVPDSGGDSPDRMDALVHASRHFMAAEKRNMRIASPAEALKALQGQQELAGYVPEDWMQRYGG